MASVGGLGAFLRARRGGIKPADVGLPAGTGLRRTPGLRREELAALAGVSIDYYIRLEQGRETNPSPAVLDALANALLLDDEERTHLHALARHATRTGEESGVSARNRERSAEIVAPGIRQLLDTLRPNPAYVVNQISDVLAANPEGLALFHGLADWPPSRRNTARYTFLHPAAKEVFADWPHSAATTAANLHAVAANQPGAPGLPELVDELTAHSPDFANLWQRYDIRRRQGEPKTFRHPQVGTITLTYEVLHISDSQRISIYQAVPGSTERDALELLAMIAGDVPAAVRSVSTRGGADDACERGDEAARVRPATRVGDLDGVVAVGQEDQRVVDAHLCTPLVEGHADLVVEQPAQGAGAGPDRPPELGQ
jgi:transcriptional regulator with XRE-family HTH domain